MSVKNPCDPLNGKTYLQTLAKLLLLLVNDTEAEIDLIGLLEFGGHAHNLRESLLGVIERPVAII